jgi:hypothetical protein
MSPPDRLDVRHGGGGTPVDTPLFRGRRPLAPGPHSADRIPDFTPGRADHPRHSSERITRPSEYDLRLSGSRAGDEPGWTDVRIGRWLHIFLGLGVALRLLRLGLNYPLWNDEAYLALNVRERDFVGLLRPLDYAQVCPPLFLWAEKAVSLTIGFSEWSLRLLPAIASVASLILFRHVAGRLLNGVSLALAVAILAIGYSPVRFGGEVKPYATDFLVALGLIALAVEWLRQPGRTGFLWGLAALGPLAIGISNPAIFVAVSVGLVLALPVVKTRSPRAITALALFGSGSAATFLVLLRWVNGPQSDHVMSWMLIGWADAFPPRSPVPLLGWLVKTHTSQMFAYPAGGVHGASALTTGLAAAAIAAYLRRGSKTVLALLLTPFALGLIAAALGRYPYGGSARTMQYVAPSIILMAGLGAAVLLARLPRPQWRERSPRWALAAMLAIGLGMMVWDVTHPFKLPFFQESRDLARRFWAEESAGAELLCAWTDLRLPLDPMEWQGGRAVMYLCHQAIYSPRHAAGKPPQLDRVSETHPLRIVVFNETPGDATVISHWIGANASHYELRARRELLLNLALQVRKSVFSDRYVVYELVPAGVGATPAPEVKYGRPGNPDGAGQHVVEGTSPGPADGRAPRGNADPAVRMARGLSY